MEHPMQDTSMLGQLEAAMNKQHEEKQEAKGKERAQQEADLEAWLSGLPEALRPTGRRHGRHLTSFVLACGAATHAFGLIHGVAARNREIMQPLVVIQQTMDGLAQAVMEDNGWTQAHFAEVQMDIKRAGSLALVEPGKTKSGIILAH